MLQQDEQEPQQPSKGHGRHQQQHNPRKDLRIVSRLQIDSTHPKEQ